MRRALALIAIVLALGACEAKAEIDVKDDGSGTFGFSFFVEQQFLAMMSLGGGEATDPFAEFKNELKDAPVPFDVKEYSEKGGRGIRATVPFDDVEGLREIMEQMEDEEGGTDGPGFGGFTLERRGEGWHFEAMSEAPDLGDLGNVGEMGEGDPPIDPAQIASLLKISFRVTLPGRTEDSTADDVTARGGRTTFVWNADLTKPAPIRMVATTAPSGSKLPLVPILIGVGVLAVVAVSVFAMRRSKTAAGTDAPADAWPSGTGGAVPPPPGGAAPSGGMVPPAPGTEQDPLRPPEPPAP